MKDDKEDKDDEGDRVWDFFIRYPGCFGMVLVTIATLLGLFIRGCYEETQSCSYEDRDQIVSEKEMVEPLRKRVKLPEEYVRRLGGDLDDPGDEVRN